MDVLHVFTRLFIFAVAALLAACGEESLTCDATESAGKQGEQCAPLMVEITDADGDFLAYGVDVLSLELERADGTRVETLPMRARIDFAQYVELTELLTAASVPHGVYVGGRIRLDYGAAELVVERGGEAVAAVAVDESGEVAGEIELALHFGESGRLVIVPGVPARLTLDFDLAASHTVDLAPTPVEVIVRPALVASVDRDFDRPQRLRGPLLDVEVDSSSYVIAVRPFHLAAGHFGRLRIQTGASTAFEIDGTGYVGAAGLAALAAKADGTATVALGTWHAGARAYLASEVYAGSSVPGGTQDAVRGNVTARNGMTLTVRGATLMRAAGTAHFNDEVTVTLADDVVVRQAGDGAATLDAQAISVGQRTVFMGEVTSESGQPLAFTASHARLLPTHLQGTTVLIGGGQMVVDLQAIDRRDVSRFDFTGTGLVPATDADPANYEIELGDLSVEGFEPGKPVGVIGFVRPFGSAPADFTARTVIDYEDGRAQLAVGFGVEGTTSPFSVASSAGVTIDLQDPALGALHHLRRGGVVTDLLDLASAPSIAPAAQGVYAIRADGAVTAYTDFAEFRSDLQLLLEGNQPIGIPEQQPPAPVPGHPALGVYAVGHWDDAAATLTAHGVLVIMP